jgi:hypothetical protein
MKKTGLFVLLQANILRAAILSVLLLPPGAAAFECPQKGSQEGPEDCPWAGVARLLPGKSEAEIEQLLQAYAPGLPAQLEADRANPALLKLWGESINYDELANGEIADPGLLAFLSGRLGAAAPRGRLMHAGAEHTYGYLFSLLPTKFGFKRARWVRPDIEDGLGLPRGSVGPNPPGGTLLANVTCLAGGIALKDDPYAWAQLGRAAGGCSPAVKKFSFSGVKRTRLSEEVALPGGRRVVLRTDFVPFSRSAGGNTHLLVYSVYDSALRQAYLVTTFAVAQAFVETATAAGGLGRDKPVQTRYNAHVEGLTGAGKFTGTRSAARIKK